MLSVGFSDFRENFKAICELREYDRSNRTSVIVIGNVGTGKTSLFELMKREFSYSICCSSLRHKTVKINNKT
jgi:replication-associated recombination protein RarA